VAKAAISDTNNGIKQSILKVKRLQETVNCFSFSH